MDLKPICKNYFSDWSNKKLEKLEEIFADEIIIRDPSGTAVGKDECMVVNKNIFDGTEKCLALPTDMYQDGQTVVCKLNVCLNEDNAYELASIITFNEENKITEMLFYKASN